ncbi:N-acetylglucosaminyl-phosphatidylinositol de-N-acetylase isoform X2 [Phycodurus eques]|uniref:N-acetylglucosaminyl-phosphatidylinositol de-N-acetylase isoform X2 n=1 Tax=Phycodurus eques TaxID=693459 RepID=UPI002ACDA128|nr:N-acetylglucosaminyl-phosphatidylinositol de-N-acetylase isoform X2 [Phycodurus eques]
MWLVVIVVVAYVVCLKCIYYRHRRSLKHGISALPSLGRHGVEIECLVVTAHPDDECMFFGPTIIRLIECNVSVHVLCLSEGNYHNEGAQRKQELFNSCAKLGIPSSRITILDHKKLPDHPKAEWKVSLVASIIAKHLRARAFDMVLTFDGRGVSGHSNHVTIYKAVRLPFVLLGDCWSAQEICFLLRTSSQLAASLITLLHRRRKGLQAVQSRHALSSHSTCLVSVSVHHLLALHVCQHIPDDSTRTKG